MGQDLNASWVIPAPVILHYQKYHLPETYFLWLIKLLLLEKQHVPKYFYLNKNIDRIKLHSLQEACHQFYKIKERRAVAEESQWWIFSTTALKPTVKEKPNTSKYSVCCVQFCSTFLQIVKTRRSQWKFPYVIRTDLTWFLAVLSTQKSFISHVRATIRAWQDYYCFEGSGIEIYIFILRTV